MAGVTMGNDLRLFRTPRPDVAPGARLPFGDAGQEFSGSGSDPLDKLPVILPGCHKLPRSIQNGQDQERDFIGTAGFPDAGFHLPDDLGRQPCSFLGLAGLPPGFEGVAFAQRLDGHPWLGRHDPCHDRLSRAAILGPGFLDAGQKTVDAGADLISLLHEPVFGLGFFLEFLFQGLGPVPQLHVFLAQGLALEDKAVQPFGQPVEIP